MLTSGGVSTGEADHVRSAVERVGSLVFWRVAIKPGRPVAMGVLRNAEGAGAAFVGLPGNPVAVFVTFVRVVQAAAAAACRRAAADADGAAGARRLSPTGRRRTAANMCAWRCAAPTTASIEAVKHPQDGAGILTSLTETDGLLEFPEEVTAIEPGARVGFLSYAALIGRDGVSAHASADDLTPNLT